MTWLLACICLLSVAAISESRNPGLRARITQSGLSYANTVAIEALKASVEQITIPDQAGSAGSFKYSVSNIRVTQFSPPKSSLTTVPGVGLKWTGSGAAIAVAGNFHFKELFVSDSGSFTASVTGVSFSLAIKIGEDSTGRPTIASLPTDCVAEIGNIDFKFTGGSAWLLNIFRDTVAKHLKEQLNKQLCTLIEMEINRDATQRLSDLPVTTPLADLFLLDYSLTHQPLITADFMETFHKGEVYWLADRTSEAPMEAHAMANTSDTNHMVYFWVSDYVFSTMMYQGQKHGFLTHNLTAQDLPASSRSVLDTTCSGFIPKCVGALIPEIGDKYPQGEVELHITSTAMPQLTITAGGVSLVGAATIDMYAQVPGRKDTPFLATLYAKMSATVDVSLNNELLYASVKDLSLNLNAGKSAVGPIHDEFLSFLIKEALNVYFVPKLNEIGKKGFPLPVTKDIKFVNSEISFAQDTIMVATDLQFTPAVISVHDDSGPLKFIPHNAVNMSPY